MADYHQFDSSISHWGEAAFVFSLDLSYDLQTLLFGDDWNALAVTYACRSAIKEGREHFRFNREPKSLREPIQRALAGAPGSQRFVEFVENRMVSSVRFENRALPLLATFYDDTANDNATWRMRGHLNSDSFREDVFSRLDGDYFKTLFDIGIEIDRELNFGLLSDWDREVLERNRLNFTVYDPLQNLLHTADLAGRIKAVKQVLVSIPADLQTEEELRTYV